MDMSKINELNNEIKRTMQVKEEFASAMNNAANSASMSTRDLSLRDIFEGIAAMFKKMLDYFSKIKDAIKRIAKFITSKLRALKTRLEEVSLGVYNFVCNANEKLREKIIAVWKGLSNIWRAVTIFFTVILLWVFQKIIEFVFDICHIAALYSIKAP